MVVPQGTVTLTVYVIPIPHTRHDRLTFCFTHRKEGVFAALALAPLFLAKLPTGVLGGVLLQRFCPGAKGGDCLITGAEDAEDASGDAAIPAKKHVL
mmetsp:Transcript_275/g.925  ORF Transcript_275/g.925 Transcript_275/m.925 type:complete len:97 (+) Transcript_275:37-327(+)